MELLTAISSVYDLYLSYGNWRRSDFRPDSTARR